MLLFVLTYYDHYDHYHETIGVFTSEELALRTVAAERFRKFTKLHGSLWVKDGDNNCCLVLEEHFLVSE